MGRNEIVQMLYRAYYLAFYDLSNQENQHGQLDYILENLEWAITRLDMYYATEEADKNVLS